MSSEQTNTAREELIKLWFEYGSSYDSDSSDGGDMADAILAAGWRKTDKAHDAEVARQALLGWADYQQRNKGIFDYALDEVDLKDIDAWCTAVRHYADGRFPIAVPVDGEGGEHEHR